jgi:hypothetical protein
MEGKRQRGSDRVKHIERMLQREEMRERHRGEIHRSRDRGGKTEGKRHM